MSRQVVLAAMSCVPTVTVSVPALNKVSDLRACPFASQLQCGKKKDCERWLTWQTSKKNSQSSGIQRVWIDLLEKTPPFLILKLGKSIGHVLSTVPLFKKNAGCNSYDLNLSFE